MKKKCICCGIEKDIAEYYSHSQMADGHLNKSSAELFGRSDNGY